MTENKIKITQANGRPMLQWVGKKPLEFVKSFPAQLVETFNQDKNSKPLENPNFDSLKKNWQNLIFHGDNKEGLGYLLANGFRGEIDLIYIDPPFNTGVDYLRRVKLRGVDKTKIEGEEYSTQEQLMYFNNFADDTFMQFVYERLQLLKELLSDKGSIFVRFDYHFGHYIKIILDEIFGKGNFRNEIVINTGSVPKGEIKKLLTGTESLFHYTKGDDYFFEVPKIKREKIEWLEMHLPEERSSYELQIRKFFGKKILPPRGRHWALSQEKINELIKEKKIRINLDKEYIDLAGGKNKGMPEALQSEYTQVNSNWTDVPGYTINNTGYPTENSEKLLERVISCASDEDDIVLDCFMGSGTTQAVAQKLNRRWIGADINKGSIQTTIKRLQKIIKNQKDTKYPSFSHYKVNDYDLQLLRTEAIELAIQHLGIERTKTDIFFEGNLGNKLVKIIDFNHPLTLLDIQLIQDELKSRPDENRDITIVCLGKELAIDSWIEDYNKKHSVNKFDVIELRTDNKYGKFLIHKPAQAKVDIKRKDEKAIIEIKEFISPSIIERLNDKENLIKIKIPDFRSMIDVVLVDNNYNGKVFNITHSDVPEKKSDMVERKYEIEIPKEKTTIAVKIIDMLGEEVLVTKEI